MNEKAYIAVAAAVVLVIAVAAAAAAIVRRISKAGRADGTGGGKGGDDPSCQDRLPLRDVSGYAMVLEGGRYVYGIEVGCKNRDLMTVDERIRDIRAVASKIGPVNRTFALMRAKVPVDTTRDARLYDEQIDECRAEISALSRSGETGRKLRYQQARIERLARWRERSASANAGESAKNAAYVLFPAEDESDRDAALEAARQMRDRMSQAGYRAKMLMGPMHLDLAMAYQGKAALELASMEVARPFVPALYGEPGDGACPASAGDERGWG